MSSSSTRRPQLSSRLVLAFFLVATVLVAVLYTKIFAAAFRIAGLHDSTVLGRDFTISTMVALAFTVVSLIYTLRATAAYEFVKQVAEELVKVTWPTLDESKAQTINTIVVTSIIGLILFSFDSVFGALTNILLSSPT